MILGITLKHSYSFATKAVRLIDKYPWELLVIQVIGLILYLHRVNIDAGVAQYPALTFQISGDQQSYTNFPLHSFRDAIGYFRTFGIPVFVGIYRILFTTFDFWPYFQFAGYSISIGFLFWAMDKSGFSRIIAFITAFSLLWYMPIYTQMPYIMPEVICNSFLYLVVGMMFLAGKCGKKIIYVFFTMALIFLYQIRPNLSYLVFLIPLWAAVFHWLLISHDFKTSKQVFLRFCLMSIVPLLLIGCVRMVFTGQYGLSNGGGGNLAGHATHFLRESTLANLNGENKHIAAMILERKRKLSFPCNLSPFTRSPIPGVDVIKVQEDCFPFDSMIAGLTVIKYENNREPYEKAEYNIEPWLHTKTLEDFFINNYHISTDNKLMAYSWAVFQVERDQLVGWISREFLFGLRYLFWNRMHIFFYVFLIAATLVTHVLIPTRIRRKYFYERWIRQLLLISIIAVTNFFVGYFLLLVLTAPSIRYFIPLAPFVLPALLLWTIPPVWKEEKIQVG